MGKVVGIDLGTTNSVVSVIEGGKPVVIANMEGMRTTPSVVAFSKEGERLVGQMARRQAVLNPQNTFYNVKRYLGRKYTELSSDSKRVPYTVRKDEEGNIKIRCPRLDRDFAPEEISAMVLRKLAEEASRYMGQPVTGAVITVPAYFNDAQRQATRDAGRIAGLEVKRIINEPTAAALAYGLEHQFNQTILVFDLGGGTFDVSILDVRNGVFEVKSTSGDTQLGGVNFDKKIVDWLADEFLETEGVDLRRDRQALQRLTEAAEKAKVELSGLPTVEINLPFITATADGPKHIEKKLSRSQFETLCADLIGRLRSPLQQAMNDARLSPSQIDEVVLVGGSSRMPMVQQLVRSMLSKEPSQNVNPDEAVGVGAAIQAGILTDEVKDIMLLDVTPLSLGLETIGGVMKKVIPRNTTIPVRRSDVFSTSENNQTIVEVHVLQGEREMGVDNKSLGRFKLMGIPPAPRGIPQVQVSFDIDANGILQVSAMDKTTGREQSITVQEASNLSEDDVQAMLREAEEFADVDRGQRERIEKRNRSETLTFQAERAMRSVSIDFGLQFARDRKRRIDNLIQDLRDALKREDERMIDMIQSELQDELYELNREAYLYDADNDSGNIFTQIGDTIKKAFEDDDDYSRRDYGWNGQQQSQWDSPSWSAGRRDNRSGWDDWDDSWNRPPAGAGGAGGAGNQRYDAQRGGYGSGSDGGGYGQNQGRGYDAPRDNYGQNAYGQKADYDQSWSEPSRNGQDRSSQDSYDQGSYGQSGYGQGQGQDSYGQSGYGQSEYGQSEYGQGQGRYNPDNRQSNRPNERQAYGNQPYGQGDYKASGSEPDWDQGRTQNPDRPVFPRNQDRQSGGWQSAPRDPVGGAGTPPSQKPDNWQSPPPSDQAYGDRPPSRAPGRDPGQRNYSQDAYPQNQPAGYGQGANAPRQSYESERYQQGQYPRDQYPQDNYRQETPAENSAWGGGPDPGRYAPPNAGYPSSPTANPYPASVPPGDTSGNRWTANASTANVSVDDDPWADQPSEAAKAPPQGDSANPGRTPNDPPRYNDDDWGDQDERW
ncbi:molecular chaperone DnaK [Leptothoe sp. PORK10 BA2]|uniref:molecular chaperone DnaK n=1 Tax=Leptothoe sp. PORK10 BA2 TaxID=3110254 RepID=UPI002B1F6DF3|nr:molecular chaperone DnaK [Leptothoe sp. PORK10 BA2]MEA5465493.1 molecular chaperone DnaK [Leptothoe sp. PORK10 BA2]